MVNPSGRSEDYDNPADARAIAIRSMLVQRHSQSKAESIIAADESGCFGSALLPFVFPVVVDANFLRDEVLADVRRSTRTVLANASNTGVLRMFCALHVVEEVTRDLTEWSLSVGLDPVATHSVWESTYQPLLRCVDPVPPGFFTTSEETRLAALAAPRSEGGDPEDVPTAMLALLLGAPLLEAEKRVLRAVYGPKVNHVSHKRDLSAGLRAGGDMGPLGEVIQGLASLAFLIGTASTKSLRALGGSLVGQVLLGMAVVSAAIGLRSASPQARRRVLSSLGTSLGIAVSIVGEIFVSLAAARAEFEKFAPPSPTSEEVASDRGRDAALVRACLRILAASPESNLSAAELSRRLGNHRAYPTGETKVRAALRAWPCFVEPYRGRFQVGASIDHPTTTSAAD